ncbi:MAG: dihydroorotase family protein [Thaumarchaeota archaeon]|nr:dihydroorotase family protein [Nitrososphaerota archaeon]
MEHDLVLEGKVVMPSGVKEMEVGVSDGRIAELRKYGVKGARRIRAARSLIFPGFVDIHVHLREPGWEYKEDFRTGSKAALHGGVTTVVDMPNNLVPASTPQVLDEKKRLAGGKALVDVGFYGGILEGHVDELERIAGKIVGFKLYLARTTGDLLFPDDELEEAFGVIGKLPLPVSLHCEDQSIIDKKARELAGVTRPDVYCDLRPPEAEVESVAKVLDKLRKTGGPRANVCHASTRETLRMVSEARAGGLQVECEAALHHLYFNRKAMMRNGLLKTNPPLRAEYDREALVNGLSEGGVSFLVTDHAPHTLDDKSNLDSAGVPGLDDFAHVVSWLVKQNGIDPITIAKVACSNPAEFAGFSDRGRIEVGKLADFAVLDLYSSEKVRTDDIMSKCGWSPYEGVEFPGRARWAVKRGEVLLDEFELVT